jgi:hypothetical protein
MTATLMPSGRRSSVHVLRESLERPVGADTGLQRGNAHALDALESAQDQLAMLGPRRRDTEAAVSHHDGGHAMPRRDGEHGIPQDLRVVVRVNVDEARRHDMTRGVDRLARLARRGTEGEHLAILDADIALTPRSARTVDDLAADDLDVVRHYSTFTPVYSIIIFQ